MNKKPNSARIDDDNPEWTAEDIKTAMPFSSLPASLKAKLGGRGPQKAAPKTPPPFACHLSAERYAASAKTPRSPTD